MVWNSTFLQDGIEFFGPMREHLEAVIKEEAVEMSVESALQWALCELFETVYALTVDNHCRGGRYEEIFTKAKRRWDLAEVTFRAVFRGPPASWDDDSIQLRINQRDLYIHFFRDKAR